MGGKPIYIKPSITDIPKPLYERIYNTIRKNIRFYKNYNKL